MIRRSQRLRHSSTPSWSDLPQELLEPIALKLKHNYGDVQLLRCVCKAWRHAIPSPLRLCPVLPRNFHPLDDQNQFFTTAVYVLRQGKNRWLLTLKQSPLGEIQILHPITQRPVKNLPENFLRNSLFNVDSTQEITRSFNIKYDDNNYDFYQIADGKFKVLQKPYKVILWPNPKVKSPGPQDHSYVVLGSQSGKLFCFRTTQGHSYLTYQGLKIFDDMVHWKNGLIYAVETSGRLFGIEYETMRVVTVFVTTRLMPYMGHRSQLMVSDGKLYMVKSKSGILKVFELDEASHLWNELKSLGDRILFMRPSSCFMIQASDLPGCQKDCVVVIPRMRKKKEGTKSINNIPQHASSLFKGTGDYVKVRLYKYGEADNKKFELISLCPGFSDALWPPPSWLTDTKESD